MDCFPNSLLCNHPVLGWNIASYFQSSWELIQDIRWYVYSAHFIKSSVKKVSGELSQFLKKVSIFILKSIINILVFATENINKKGEGRGIVEF